MTGWFGFKTPQDLLGKLERELAKLERDPSDADAAFNFFITAWSLVDWLGLKDKKSLRQKEPVIAACAHLADGSKHFHLDNTSHTSVGGTARGGDWAKQPLRMDPGQRPASSTGLFVRLEGDAAKHFGAFPSALVLARETIAWFRKTVPSAT